MFLHILILIAGLAAIIIGGNLLTDGAESVARRFKISTAVIGMTVVAFGSSAPDFVISFTSTLQGHSELAIGDVVGANIFDLLLVTGVIAVMAPVPMTMRMATRDMALLAISGLALFFAADTILIDGFKTDVISRSSGCLLLLFFAIFMGYTAMTAKSNPATPQPAADAKPKPPMPIWRACVYILVGLAALVVGGNWIVDGASKLALAVGMSEGMVGLTVVALGSSAPDLATSAVAARKNQPGIALGNLVGACIFNVFFILGFCGAVEPLAVGHITFVDFATLAVAGILLYIFGLRKGHTLNRAQGIVLIAMYVAYMVYVIWRG